MVQRTQGILALAQSMPDPEPPSLASLLKSHDQGPGDHSPRTGRSSLKPGVPPAHHELWSECACCPKFVCWNPTPSVMAFGGRNFGRWLGYEGGASINDISAFLYKRDPSDLLCPFYHVRTLQKDSAHEPGGGPSSNIEFSCTLILDFPGFQNFEEYISVVHKTPSLWYSVIAA